MKYLLSCACVLLAATPILATTVEGTVYHDEDLSTISHYEQQIDHCDAPLYQVEVSLIGTQGQSTALTNGSGRFEFENVSAGTYLLDYEIDAGHECTSNDRPAHVADAVREGNLHIVTIGDSIGAVGSDVLYPQRLADHFAQLCEVEVTNLAKGGSTSFQWLPGADRGYFDERLAPVLPAADLLTITLGGNDPDPYIEGMPPYDVEQIVRNFLDHPEYLLEILPNIKTIIEAAWAINPQCDVVFVVYPNFALSSEMEGAMGDMHPLALFGMGLAMTIVREELATMPGIVLGDMFGGLGDTWLDPYMLDMVHSNDAGHQLYADIIFECLGGVVISNESRGEERMIGFYAQDYLPDDDDDDDVAPDDDDDSAGDDDGDHGASLPADSDEEQCCG
ncbi:MAG: GDSL-type esterase/lipase family protein [Candidatus Alcyoniella australis]|nr:GDSL-type esterase/lipase family protein [Candidatus Alcyoniella australis]